MWKNIKNGEKMRDKKHRIINTIILVAGFIIAIGVFFMIKSINTNEIAAIIAFCTGVIIIIMHQMFTFKNLKHKITKINSLTQIWLGVLILVASIMVLALHSWFGVDFSTALIWMASLIIIMILLSIKKFDKFIEKKAK